MLLTHFNLIFRDALQCSVWKFLKKKVDLNGVYLYFAWKGLSVSSGLPTGLEWWSHLYLDRRFEEKRLAWQRERQERRATRGYVHQTHRYFWNKYCKYALSFSSKLMEMSYYHSVKKNIQGWFDDDDLAFFMAFIWRRTFFSNPCQAVSVNQLVAPVAKETLLIRLNLRLVNNVRVSFCGVKF